MSIHRLSPQSLRLLQELSYLAPDDAPCSLFNEDQLALNDALTG